MNPKTPQESDISHNIFLTSKVLSLSLSLSFSAGLVSLVRTMSLPMPPKASSRRTTTTTVRSSHTMVCPPSSITDHIAANSDDTIDSRRRSAATTRRTSATSSGIRCYPTFEDMLGVGVVDEIVPRRRRAYQKNPSTTGTKKRCQANHRFATTTTVSPDGPSLLPPPAAAVGVEGPAWSMQSKPQPLVLSPPLKRRRYGRRNSKTAAMFFRDVIYKDVIVKGHHDATSTSLPLLRDNGTSDSIHRHGAYYDRHQYQHRINSSNRRRRLHDDDFNNTNDGSSGHHHVQRHNQEIFESAMKTARDAIFHLLRNQNDKTGHN